MYKKSFIKTVMLSMLFILCTGWTSRYEVNVSFDSFSDKLTMTFNYNLNNLTALDSDTRESVLNLVENDIISAGRNKFYNKTVNASDGYSTIVLEDKYNYQQFKNNNILVSCFDNFDVFQDNKYIDIIISGKFNCDEYKFDKLFLKTNNKINANNHYADGEYLVWNLNEEWNDIQISITRTSHTIYIIILGVIGTLILIGICLFIIKFIKSNRM